MSETSSRREVERRRGTTASRYACLGALALGALVLAPGGTAAQVTRQQTVTGAASGTSLTMPSINGGTNQTYVLSISAGTPQPIVSVTGGGLAWTQRVSQCGASNGATNRVWTAQGSPGAFQAVITYAGSQDIAAVLSRYSGVGAIQVPGGENGNGPNGTCGNGPSTSTAQLTLGSTRNGSVHVISVAPVTVVSTTAGYQLSGSTNQGPTYVFVYDKAFPTAGSEQFQATLSSSTKWATAGLVLAPPLAPTLSSAANQTFPVSDPPRAISTITITESTTPSITAANDIRIRIPAGLNMTWDSSDLTAVIGGAAAGKVSTTVSYEDGGKTLVLNATANFAASDQITVSGLGFANFSAPSGAASLGLEVANDDVVVATDGKTIAIVAAGVPTISSEFDQSFRVGDPAITISTISVTDDATTRSITAVGDIRIRIPAGFPMSWDVTDTTAFILGSAQAKVSSTVRYEDGGKTLVINVLTDFAPNDIITIAGLSFRNFTAAAAPDNLELEVRNDDVVVAQDDKVVFIVFIPVTPSLVSASDQSFLVGDPPTEIVSIRVTDDPQPQITAANDIRIRIPPGLDMIWDTTNVTPQFSGRANNKVANTVTYEDGGKTLVIDVITNFAADDWLNVRKLSFMSFVSASFAERLELEVYNDGIANTLDTRTKTIFGATYDVAVVPASQTASRLPSNATNYTVDFTVANIGSIVDSYDLLTSKLPGGTITVVSISGTGVTQGGNPDSARLANLANGATRVVTVTYAVAMVPPGTTDTLIFRARSVGAPSKEDAGRLELTVIRPSIATAKTVNPTGTQLPGTDLSYHITVTNGGTAAAASVVTVDSLSPQVEFKIGSVVSTPPAGVGVTVEYSNDGGASWTYTPAAGGCGAAPAYDRCVTHVRWRFLDPVSQVAPENLAQLEFVARIR